jgi:hypothetical protein
MLIRKLFVRAIACNLILSPALLVAQEQSRFGMVPVHHSGQEMAVMSPRCGYTEGENLRDRRHLDDFCERSVPAGLRIRGAGAVGEHLWIEAPADLALTLRADDQTAKALLREWLAEWRKVTGYRNATVTLLHGHVEFARAQATMTGDAIRVR